MIERDPAPTTRAATLDDAQFIAAHIRAQDATELAAMGADAQAVVAGFHASLWSDVATAHGQPVCIYGVSPSQVDSRIGLPWLIGTPAMEALGRHFIRGCAPVVQRMLDAFPVLVNVTHCGNTVAQRWLRWLDFQFAPSPAGCQFLGFWKAQPQDAALALGWLVRCGVVDSEESNVHRN